MVTRERGPTRLTAWGAGRLRGACGALREDVYGGDSSRGRCPPAPTGRGRRPASHPHGVNSSRPPDVTRLLREVQDGREGASDELASLVYAELHDLASRFMRNERGSHTLQPTALVNEAYMRLSTQRGVAWQNRSHFFGIASQSMRRILVDHARRRRASKRDGGVPVTLDESVPDRPDRSLDVLALDDALRRLAELDPRQARVVELRFFGGLEIEQVAEVLEISPATVKRDWTFARAFLHRLMSDEEPPAS